LTSLPTVSTNDPLLCLDFLYWLFAFSTPWEDSSLVADCFPESCSSHAWSTYFFDLGWVGSRNAWVCMYAGLLHLQQGNCKVFSYICCCIVAVKKWAVVDGWISCWKD